MGDGPTWHTSSNIAQPINPSNLSQLVILPDDKAFIAYEPMEAIFI